MTKAEEIVKNASGDGEALYRLASDPNTPCDVLEALYKGEGYYLSAVIEDNPNASYELRQRILLGM
jgi:hypothetical protein